MAGEPKHTPEPWPEPMDWQDAECSMESCRAADVGTTDGEPTMTCEEKLRECVLALHQLVKCAHLYRTSSAEARQRVLFGHSLNEALPQAITEAKDALAHAEGKQP